jgi:protein O-mannosyl-transferase
MYGLMFYVQKMIWPMGLACLYELPRVFDPLEPRFVAAYVFTSAAGIIALLSWRRWPAVTAAFAAFAVIIAPVLGFHQSGPQIVADRYSYLANISWVILIAGGVLRCLRRPRLALPALVVGLAVVATLSVLTWRQTGYWRDSEALFKRAVDVGPDGPIVREFYGRQLSELGKKEAALHQFQKGTELDSGYAECWFSLANTLKDLGRFPEAEQSYMAARKLMADSWRASLMQGMMYITISDRLKEDPDAAAKAIKGAEMCFRAAISNVEALRANPVPGRPYLMLAAVLDMQGDEQGSRTMLEKAALSPDTREEALQHLRDHHIPK